MVDFHQRLNFCEWSLTRSFWHEMTVQGWQEKREKSVIKERVSYLYLNKCLLIVPTG